VRPLAEDEFGAVSASGIIIPDTAKKEKPEAVPVSNEIYYIDDYDLEDILFMVPYEHLGKIEMVMTA
jgi:co-chaperonin GroES (HSP10)